MSPSKQDVKKHSSRSGVLSVTDFDVEERDYTCSLCLTTFTNKQALGAHHRWYHSDSTVKSPSRENNLNGKKKKRKKQRRAAFDARIVISALGKGRSTSPDPRHGRYKGRNQSLSTVTRGSSNSESDTTSRELTISPNLRNSSHSTIISNLRAEIKLVARSARLINGNPNVVRRRRIVPTPNPSSTSSPFTSSKEADKDKLKQRPSDVVASQIDSGTEVDIASAEAGAGIVKLEGKTSEDDEGSKCEILSKLPAKVLCDDFDVIIPPTNRVVVHHIVAAAVRASLLASDGREAKLREENEKLRNEMELKEKKILEIVKKLEEMEARELTKSKPADQQQD